MCWFLEITRVRTIGRVRAIGNTSERYGVGVTNARAARACIKLCLSEWRELQLYKIGARHLDWRL